MQSSLIKMLNFYSQELIDEIVEVLQRSKFRKYFYADDVENLLLKIKVRSIFIDVTIQINVCRNSKNNFLLLLSADGNATHLLTGDRDLLIIKIKECQDFNYL